jgi:hypothetical protein
MEGPPSRGEDPELWAVHDEFRRVSGAVDLIGEAIRDAFDQAYDGQNSGRWDYRQLNKTEKTHIGTLVQINIHRYLTLEDGRDLDYRVAGVEVDCKWSRMMGDWEIPEEMYLKNGPQVALLIWGNDFTARWCAGLIRTHETNLRPKGLQRDRKRKLNSAALDKILWLEREGQLIPNQLLRASPAERRLVLGQRSGQACVDMLFKVLAGQLVTRSSVVTAAMQDDPMKRVRDARKNLRAKGYIILGHYAPHPDLAADLGLPRPALGSFVSAKLSPRSRPGPGTVDIQGERWGLAVEIETSHHAPELPRQGREQVEPAPLHLEGGT